MAEKTWTENISSSNIMLKNWVSSD